MADHNKAQVIAALRHAPGYEGVPETSDIQRLGGLTNLVYRVAPPGKPAVIVRIPGAGTEDYINREVELHNAQVAARAGISATVIWGDPESGVMISECIENIVTMTPENFKTRKGAAGRAGVAFRQLHDAPEPFEFRFELFAMIDDYLGILSGKTVDLPEGYHKIVAAAQPIKALLEEKPAVLKPCHCDPLCENFLDDGRRMWIVDFEYSGMNDPLWDLGDLSVEAGFDATQDGEMMRAYFGAEPSPAQQGRMVIYKAMCDLLWTLWGLIQHADGNPAEDFWAYSVGRFERCKTLMNSPGFEDHLDAMRKG